MELAHNFYVPTRTVDASCTTTLQHGTYQLEDGLPVKDISAISKGLNSLGQKDSKGYRMVQLKYQLIKTFDCSVQYISINLSFPGPWLKSSLLLTGHGRGKGCHSDRESSGRSFPFQKSGSNVSMTVVL